MCRALLRGADLSGALFRETDLHETDVTSARVGWTCWINLDLRTVKGLHTLIHIAPSTIGIDTLSRSQGHIPMEFLRQAGVPDDLLTQLPSQELHGDVALRDRKSTRLNSSHTVISYAVFCLI